MHNPFPLHSFTQILSTMSGGGITSSVPSTVIHKSISISTIINPVSSKSSNASSTQEVSSVSCQKINTFLYHMMLAIKHILISYDLSY